MKEVTNTKPARWSDDNDENELDDKRIKNMMQDTSDIVLPHVPHPLIGMVVPCPPRPKIHLMQW